MDIIKMARELGAAIQQDERYLNFKKAREANEADKPLNDLIGELNLIQMNYQQEAQKEEPSEEKMQDFCTGDAESQHGQLRSSPQGSGWDDELSHADLDPLCQWRRSGHL